MEEAMLAGKIDFAVHSYKDLPTLLPDGLAVVCVPDRDSPFDALFSHDSQGAETLNDLPENPVIASGSLRRKAQILIARPDAEVVDIRGNVNTRLQKFDDSDWAGLIMAHAAIRRMEWEEKNFAILQPDEMLPAPAQGALAVEAREDDVDTRELLAHIHDETTAVGVVAERVFLAKLEGGCQVPIAAYATCAENTITLEGLISSTDGKQHIRSSASATGNPAELGEALADEMLANGGEEIIEALKAMNEK